MKTGKVGGTGGSGLGWKGKHINAERKKEIKEEEEECKLDRGLGAEFASVLEIIWAWKEDRLISLFKFFSQVSGEGGGWSHSESESKFTVSLPRESAEELRDVSSLQNIHFHHKQKQKRDFCTLAFPADSC